MATFQGLAPAQAFVGTVGDVDSVSYLRQPGPGGVTLSIDNPGLSGGFALGDTFISIDRFLLSRQGDGFVGSSAAETVYAYEGDDTLNGMGGDDFLSGGDGNDVFSGGEGVDSMDGGAGNDRFIVGDGDGAAGERYLGGDGNDTISLFGAGGDWDLRGATISQIEAIDFGASGLLTIDFWQDLSLIQGTAAAGEIVEIDYSLGNEQYVFSDVKTLLDNQVDEVRWDSSVGDVSAVRNHGLIDITYDNETAGAVPRSYSLLTYSYTDAEVLVQITNVGDDDVTSVTSYSPTGQRLTLSIVDNSADGSARSYQTFDASYDAITGDIKSSTELQDTGALRVRDYDNGVLSEDRTTDLADAFSYEERLIQYQNGVKVLTTTEYDDGRFVIIGESGSQTLEGGTENDRFTGGAGNDTFSFQSGFGSDQITDFDTNGDLLDFTAFGITTRADFEAAGTITQVGAHTVLTLTGEGSVTLLNTSEGSIDYTDFFVV